ncbi:MAG: hypothetical protein IPI30_21510 [Saprospiraceae bacterium]|nr:hypothetical protein [Candidatus Vicinibacter affinis]
MNAQIKLGVLFSVCLSVFPVATTQTIHRFPLYLEINLKKLYPGCTILEFEDSYLRSTFAIRMGMETWGFEEPDSYAVFIRDARLTKYDGFTWRWLCTSRSIDRRSG